MTPWARSAVRAGPGCGRPSMPCMACAAALAVAAFAAGAAWAQHGDALLPGTVAFDSDRYGIGDTVTVTVRDDGLNADPGRIDSYGIDPGTGFVGERGRIILDVTLDGQPWSAAHADPGCLAVLEYTTIHAGLDATGFSLTESGRDTGVFAGIFQVPREWCPPGAKHPEVSANIGLEANYFEGSGTAPAGARAAVVAHSGSVSLDRAVYPVPFGEPLHFSPLPALVAEEDAARGALDRLEALHELQDLVYTAMDEQLLYPRELAHALEGDMRSLFAGVRGGSDDWNDILDSLHDAIDDAEDETYGMRELDAIVRDRTRAQLDLAAEREGADPWGKSYFPIHSTGFGSDDGIAYIPNGHLIIHIRVSDADYDVSAAGRDEMAEDGDGPVTIYVKRGYDSYKLGTAGGTETGPKLDRYGNVPYQRFGPMQEVAPDAGVFEAYVAVWYSDGPPDQRCPIGYEGCILQGDIIQVEYEDSVDKFGDRNTVTDSAVFGLRTAVLLSDRASYMVGDDMTLTLIEPDLDLDGGRAESYPLDVIEWDSDAATITMGSRGGQTAAFDPEPAVLMETGNSTGIFQVMVRMPEELEGNRLLESGEDITLEYTDWGPAGADYVGDEAEDAVLHVVTSEQAGAGNATDRAIPEVSAFDSGVTIHLDQRVYTWTDRVVITVTAPDQNHHDDLLDRIGNADTDRIEVSTREHDLDWYALYETGTDTGVFAGEVTLTGFVHDADGDRMPDARAYTGGAGPSGLLEATGHDVLTVSYEFGDHTATAFALVRWNVGEVEWLRSSHPANGAGTVRVIDPDMNLRPEVRDVLGVRVWSDSDREGLRVLAVETGEATGVFEGAVAFRTGDGPADRLAVGGGGMVTAT